MVLFAHKREAYRAASVMLSETGKAFIGFSFCAAPPEVDYFGWISSSRRNPLESKGRATLNAVSRHEDFVLSATDIRSLDNQRDMVLELFDGHIASKITLRGHRSGPFVAHRRGKSKTKGT